MAIAIPGDPAPIVVKRDVPGQTIFTYFPDRTLSGIDYPDGCENLLTLTCTLDPDDPKRIMITGLPQIRTNARKVNIVREGDAYSMVAQPTIYSLLPMEFQLTVPSNDVLIIGPGAMARRSSSPGHHFLMRQKDGMEFETVLLLMPEVFAAPLKR
jgi:hypothetical protein